MHLCPLVAGGLNDHVATCSVGNSLGGLIIAVRRVTFLEVVWHVYFILLFYETKAQLKRS